jgi:hypothetical protein
MTVHDAIQHQGQINLSIDTLKIICPSLHHALRGRVTAIMRNIDIFTGCLQIKATLVSHLRESRISSCLYSRLYKGYTLTLLAVTILSSWFKSIPLDKT